MAPKMPREARRTLQDGFRLPKRSQRKPKGDQHPSKTYETSVHGAFSPVRFQNGPRELQEGPQRPPRRPQDRPKRRL
eukprot:4758545-Pyramimonas_sp.AAC.1